MTFVMPTSSATARAVLSLSPLTRIGSMPIRRNSAMAALLVGRTESETATAPRHSPPQTTATTVAPRDSHCETKSSSQGAPSSVRPELEVIQPGRPTWTRCPSTRPLTPSPRSLRKSSTGGTSSSVLAFADTAMARATGCSLAFSTAPAITMSSSSVTPCAATSAIFIRPLVIVPVLSRTIVSIRRVRSRISGPRMRMPICAPRPVPTSSAVGVANPRAQGQAMISTATAAAKAACTL